MYRADHLLRRFWRELHEQKIPYCVVGDTDGLPERIDSDVDMVVSDEHLQRMPELVLDFCQAQGVQIVQRLVHERTAVYLVLAWLEADGVPGFLALDFCSDYLRRGRRLLKGGEVLASRRPRAEGPEGGGFYVAAPAIEFIYYLLKKVDKGSLDARHAVHLSAQWRLDPEAGTAQIERFWRDDRWRTMLSAAAASGDWECVQKALPQLRRALRRGCPITFADQCGEWLRRAQRWWRPTGFMLAVLGADGSGKSTVIERLRDDWAPAFRQVRYTHLRPRLFARDAGATAAVTDPHGRPPRGTLASLIKLTWFVGDYIGGYVLRIRPWTARSALVVFDRYFDDLYLDPKRYRFGAPLRWARAAARLVPRPDLWLVLNASARTLQARKQEVSAEVSALQQQAYAAFERHDARVQPIDADRAFEHVRAQVNALMLVMLRAKVEREMQRAAWRNAHNPTGTKALVTFCRRDVPVLGRMMRILFNSDIYCRLAWPPSLPHPYGIIVHSQAEIGRGVTIMQQVTIGGKHGTDLAPCIDDHVYIGAGAKVLGGIRVGRGATIGANAVVTKDVPPGATVVGANRVLQRNDGAAARNLDGAVVEQLRPVDGSRHRPSVASRAASAREES